MPNPTNNNFLNITGGVTSQLILAMVVFLDGTGVGFTYGGTYSYLVGQAPGNDFSATTGSNLNIPYGQFTFIGFAVPPTDASLTGDASGNLYVNFTVSTVPEPA